MINFTNVFKSYENGTTVLRGISFEVEDGEFVFVVGPSGSGKSTVMKLMTGEIRPSQGSVEVNGYEIGRIRRGKLSKLRRTLGIVFQDFRLLEKKTVYDNIAFAMRIVGASGREIRQRVPEVLAQVGLENSGYCYPAELSGGEQQRVAIARALVNRPSIIIADEPTGNIDPARSIEIMSLLEEINNMGTTVLVVTHEKTLVDRMGKRVIAIDEGMLVRDSVGQYDDGEPLPVYEEPETEEVRDESEEWTEKIEDDDAPYEFDAESEEAEDTGDYDYEDEDEYNAEYIELEAEPDKDSADIDEMLSHLTGLNITVPEPQHDNFSKEELRGIVTAMLDDVLKSDGEKVHSGETEADADDVE